MPAHQAAARIARLLVDLLTAYSNARKLRGVVRIIPTPLAPGHSGTVMERPAHSCHHADHRPWSEPHQAPNKSSLRLRRT